MANIFLIMICVCNYSCNTNGLGNHSAHHVLSQELMALAHKS